MWARGEGGGGRGGGGRGGGGRGGTRRRDGGPGEPTDDMKDRRGLCIYEWKSQKNLLMDITRNHTFITSR